MEVKQQVDELQIAVFGRDDQQEPGLKRRVKTVEDELSGINGALGLKQKVSILWKLHLWVLCTLSGAAGSLLTLMVQRIVTHK